MPPESAAPVAWPSRAIHCPWCRHRVGDAARQWDRIVEKGQCARCERFVERDYEQRVEDMLRNPELAVTVRNKRIISLVVGIVTLLAFVSAVVLFFFHMPKALFIAFVLGPISYESLRFAVRWSPEREARQTLQHPLKLDDNQPFFQPPS